MLYDMLIYMMIGNAHLWILEVSEKYSYYSTQANTANKSQSDYVETHLSQKVKKVIYTISVNDVETSNEFSETETK